MKYIDLFSGCGGLSLGLEQAGFSLELAVEKSPMAAETFYHNFIARIHSKDDWTNYCNRKISEQANSRLIVNELSKLLEQPTLLSELKEKDIDLVAGGPPCQGFSLAGRRNADDIRNKLPWEFLSFVEQISPKAVMIENVSGMSQNFNKQGKSSPFNDLKIALSTIGDGYMVQPVLLNAMHFGAPQHRPRVMLIALRNDIADQVQPVIYEGTWRSEFDNPSISVDAKRPTLAPRGSHYGEAILTVADAIADLNPNGYRRISNLSEFAFEMRTDKSLTSSESIKKSEKTIKLSNHVLRNHAEHIKTRFRLYQYLRDQEIHSKILAIPKLPNHTETEKRLLIADALSTAKYPAVAPDKNVIANSTDELIALIFELCTKKHSQRPLKWSAPSPTVVSLPDDYVHPSEPRTLTVRELARFQSFPDSFEFKAKETTGSLRRRFEVPQYTQVGNAVPPKMARAVGAHIISLLSGSQ